MMSKISPFRHTRSTGTDVRSLPCAVFLDKIEDHTDKNYDTDDFEAGGIPVNADRALVVRSMLTGELRNLERNCRASAFLRSPWIMLGTRPRWLNNAC